MRDQGDINEALAVGLQKALQAHVVDPNNLSLTEEFLTRCLGGMYATLSDGMREKMLGNLPSMINDGIEEGIPEPGEHSS